jgi:hypothetical protein
MCVFFARLMSLIVLRTMSGIWAVSKMELTNVLKSSVTFTTPAVIFNKNGTHTCINAARS